MSNLYFCNTKRSRYLLECKAKKVTTGQISRECFQTRTAKQRLRRAIITVIWKGNRWRSPLPPPERTTNLVPLRQVCLMSDDPARRNSWKGEEAVEADVEAGQGARAGGHRGLGGPLERDGIYHTLTHTHILTRCKQTLENQNKYAFDWNTK